jgi:hypothetical protein
MANSSLFLLTHFPGNLPPFSGYNLSMTARSAPVGTVLLVLVFLRCAGVMLAQEADGLHEFTDKRGQKVSAVLLGVSEDRRQMTIKREDGQQFDTVINLLSLDDQQYIKDWMKNRPTMSAAPATEYRLDLSATRQTGKTVKNSYGDSTTIVLEEKENFYRITVQNLSRETLESAIVEYAIVWKNKAIIYKAKDGDWTYTSVDSDSKSEVKVIGQLDPGPMRFNAEVTLETVTVNMDRVYYKEFDELLYEDDMVGLAFRVKAADGTILQEAHTGSAAISAMTWDQITNLPDPKVYQ